MEEIECYGSSNLNKAAGSTLHESGLETPCENFVCDTLFGYYLSLTHQQIGIQPLLQCD